MSTLAGYLAKGNPRKPALAAFWTFRGSAAFPLCWALGEERFDSLFEVFAHVSPDDQVGAAVRWRHLNPNPAQRFLRRFQSERRVLADRGGDLHDPCLQPFFCGNHLIGEPY